MRVNKFNSPLSRLRIKGNIFFSQFNICLFLSTLLLFPFQVLKKKLKAVLIVVFELIGGFLVNFCKYSEIINVKLLSV